MFYIFLVYRKWKHCKYQDFMELLILNTKVNQNIYTYKNWKTASGYRQCFYSNINIPQLLKISKIKLHHTLEFLSPPK